RGSAVNQDGPSSGQTVPSGPAQQAVLRQALATARLAPADIDYVEAHGTGTALGDPIELDALSAVFGERDGAAPLVLGSVKTNLGHMESAAGVGGFIKTVLSVQHGYIPKHLNFNQLTSHASVGASRFTIASQGLEWPAVGRARRAGVSSFGVSGTNAHVVVEQAPAVESVARQPEPVVSTLVISGKSPARVASTAAVLAEWMAGEGAGVGLADVAHTVNHHRTRHKTVAAVCARDHAQAVAGLEALAAGNTAVGVLDAHQTTRGSGTVFVYSGQGSQWAGMGQKLLADEPAFAAAVAELEPVFVEQAGFSLRGVLESGEQVVGIDRIQPVLVGMQLALTALWRSYGVEPDAVIGHSMGEVTAAVVAGALSPADGLKVIATRSRLMSRLSGQGAMALLELDAAAAEKLIAEYSDLTVAVYASPGQTVIAGPPEQVDAVIAVVDAQGRLARRVEVDVASHHPTIDPILPELRTALADLAPMTPKIPLISTVGETNGVAPAFDADYWTTNLRNPVRFNQAVAAAGANHSTFVEVAPHPLLTHAINESLEPLGPRGDTQVAATLYRDNPETITFHTNLATVRPPSAEITENVSGAERIVDLPPTSWLHSRYWVASSSAGRQVAGAHPLLGMHVEIPSGRDHVWQADVGTEVIPWLADHKVHGQPVMPATGFVEMALAAASEALGLPVQAVAVNRVEVEQMLRLDGRTEVTTQLVRGTADSVDDIRVEIHSRSANGNWSRHAVARVGAAQPATLPPELTSSAEAGTVLSPADLYAALRRTGLHHGQAFAALTRIVRKPGGSSEAEIVLPDEAAPDRSYRIHPVMLDAALQCLAAALPAESLAGSVEATYLPVSVENIRVFGDVGRRARCHAELTNLDGDGAGILGRVILTDDAGTPTAELSGIFLQRVQPRTVPLPLTQKIFDATWVDTSTPVDSDPSALPEGSWLVLTDGAETEQIASDFVNRFGSPTRRVISADLSRESAVLEAFAKAAADPELPPAGVIVFAGQNSFDGADSDDSPERARDLAWAISATVRAVVGGWHGKAPRLWLVARNGLALNEDEPGDPVIGSLKGLVRVLAFEHPDLRATLVDLDTADDTLAPLITELGSTGNDDVIAWRGQHRYAERLSRAVLGAGEQDHVVRRDGAYIVTGGLGGLGLVVARWLVDSGAARVVLNGRSEPSDEQRRVLAELEESAQIAIVHGDVSTSDVAGRLVKAAEETGLALRGVVHGAAVIDDQIVAALSKESLDRVWAPKAAGALRLHAATAGRELDWWVGFSSTSSLLGAPGQGAYAAASAWLDALVAWRRASGLPAITINWGQWSDIGVARSLTFSALDPISPAEGIEALESVLAGDLSRVGVARLRLDRASAAFPEIQQLGYFATLAEELDLDSDDGDWAGPDALRDMDAAEANRVVSARLGSRVLAVMGYPKDAPIDASQALTELGMDSLMAVRIRNTVRGDFGVEPPVALLLQGASLTDLAADLIRQLGLTEQDNTESANDVRSRAQQRAASRQRAAARRKVGDRA
ncbi:MAG TPA: type I polyketide synthase, partial [Mycobacterium sp.]|nr:type I polyketide synthase [Mycobacterium sp.]